MKVTIYAIRLYLMMRALMVVRSEATEIQNEGVNAVLPLTRDSRLRLGLGFTYTMSSCWTEGYGVDALLITVLANYHNILTDAIDSEVTCF